MPTSRLALALAGVALFAVGVWLAAGPPRLTVLNAALRLDHSWTRPAAAAAAAAGAALAGVGIPRRAARVTAAIVAAGALVAAARLGVYRVELTDEALIAEGLLRRSVIPWDTVGRVEIAPSALLVFERDALLLRLETGGLTPDQLATLKRGIARRVREVHAGPAVR